jgi:SAM-dependent methyltransferase
MFGCDQLGTEHELEQQLKGIIKGQITQASLALALEKRAVKIAAQVRPWLLGSSMLDVGSGDGVIAFLLADLMGKVTLLDVARYLDPRVPLPFIAYSEGREFPFDAKFDMSLLLTVLHHSSDPLFLLRQTRKVTARRCVIIESVVGAENPRGQNEVSLASLSLDEQIMYATFVDWLYNRVVRTDVPVPYNFTTPAMWRTVLRDVGFEIEQEIDLGIDQPLVPEHHLMLIVR